MPNGPIDHFLGYDCRGAKSTSSAPQSELDRHRICDEIEVSGTEPNLAEIAILDGIQQGDYGNSSVEREPQVRITSVNRGHLRPAHCFY